jgi:hypothetical protein
MVVVRDLEATPRQHLIGVLAPHQPPTSAAGGKISALDFRPRRVLGPDYANNSIN